MIHFQICKKSFNDCLILSFKELRAGTPSHRVQPTPISEVMWIKEEHAQNWCKLLMFCYNQCFQYLTCIYNLWLRIATSDNKFLETDLELSVNCHQSVKCLTIGHTRFWNLQWKPIARCAATIYWLAVFSWSTCSRISPHQ